MSQRSFSNTIITFATLIVMLLGAASCSKPQTPSGKDGTIDYWTCTMHPSVHSKDPGKCPICGMDLVPVLKKGGSEARPSPAQAEQTKSSDMEGMDGTR